MKVKADYTLKCDFDWKEYKMLFPTRYMKESRLDLELHKIVSDLLLENEWSKILDVGGGPDFTPALRRILTFKKSSERGKLYLLDPFVTMTQADWGCEQIKWRTLETIIEFDLIVLRGSLNYLTLDEIEILGTQLKPGGLLIANSFAEPDSIKRKIVTEAGVKGVEECSPKKVDDWLGSIVMQHTLTLERFSYPNKKIIKHEFFYHRPMDVIKKLGPDGVTAEFYGNNSILYKYKKP